MDPTIHCVVLCIMHSCVVCWCCATGVQWDVVQQILSGHEDLTGLESSKYVLDPATCSMWAFNKQWLREHKLSQYTGTNEKAIIIVKLTKVKHTHTHTHLFASNVLK